jgi:DNA polymerase III epsilon subunit-like protein
MKKNNFGLIMESWRGFKTLLNEKKAPIQARNFDQALNMFKQQMAENQTQLIFFDTETTGLQTFQSLPYPRVNQITEIAAVVVDASKLFSLPYEEVMATEVGDNNGLIIDSFQQRINLKPDTIEGLKLEEEFIDWLKSLPPEKVPTKVGKDQKVRPMFRESEPNFMTTNEIFAMTNYKPNPEDRTQEEEGLYITHIDAVERFVQFCEKFPNRQLVAQNAGFDVRFMNAAFKKEGIKIPDDEVIDTLDYFKLFLQNVIDRYKIALQSANQELSDEEGKELEKKGSKLGLSTEAEYESLRQRFKESDQEKRNVILNINNSKLKTISDAFGIHSERHHEAIADVIMLFKSLRAVIHFLEQEDEAFKIILEEPKPELSPEQQGAKTAKDRERYRGEDQKIKDALKNAGAFDWEQQRIQESKIRIRIKR